MNQKAVQLALFLFLLGVSLGAFLEIELTADVRDSLWEVLHDAGNSTQSDASGTTESGTTESGNAVADFLALFGTSLLKNLPLLLLTIAAPLTIIGFPAAVLTLLIKGISLGFSAALLFEQTGLSALVPLLAGLLPQNLFLLPCFFVSTVFAIRLTACIARSPESIGTCLKVHAGTFLRRQLRLLPFLLLGCLLEALTCPVLAAVG